MKNKNDRKTTMVFWIYPISKYQAIKCENVCIDGYQKVLFWKALKQLKKFKHECRFDWDMEWNQVEYRRTHTHARFRETQTQISLANMGN